MMVNVLPGIERCQRQPWKRRDKRMTPDRVPKNARPLNVVITVEVATADCRGRKLELPEDHSNGDDAN